MDIILDKIQRAERRNISRSALISAGLMTVTFLLGWIWVANFRVLFPEQKKEYVLVGMTEVGMGLADFGNNVNGSGDDNNFHAPSATPGAGTPGHSELSANVPTPNPSNTQTVTTTQPTAPEIQADGPKQSDSPNSTTSNNNNTDPNKTGTGGNEQNTGSNHGTGDQIGDRGSPDAHVLNNDGMFAFGDGLGNRKYLELARPVYAAQQEGVLTFEFIIAPEGHVKFVKAPVSSNTALVKAGKDAIYKWKFEPIDGGGDQTSKVTITFRLK
jgi:hypothetical protein